MELDFSDSVQRKNALIMLHDAVVRALKFTQYAIECNSEGYVDLTYQLCIAAEGQLDLAEALIGRFKTHVNPH